MTDQSGLRAPSSADPKHLQRWAFELVQRLRLNDQQSVDNPQDFVDDLIDDLGPITDFGDLSDAQKLLLGLSDSVADQLALDEDVLAAIRPFVSSAGAAAVYAYLRAHQNAASVRVEQTVRETETLSLSNQITSLTADLADTDAAVINEQTARANGDSALASDITTISTTVAGHTSTLTQYGAAIDGISAEWGVAINLQGQVVGLIRLDADQSESTFTVVVDKFQVAKTDGTGVVPIFQIGTVDGVSRVALAADMLVDGYIAANALAANSVTANALAANSVTADSLAANSVTADKLNVAALSAIVADLGTVTAGRIESADGNSFWDLDNNTFQIGTI